MKIDKSFSILSNAKLCAGYGLLEVVISLVILSTTILLSASFGLKQIQQSRRALILNQWHMQVDSLRILLRQNPQIRSEFLNDWQTDCQKRFPQAKVEFTLSETHLISTIQFSSHGTLSNKTFTRTDAN